MLRAFLDFEAVWLGSIAVAGARTASAAVVNHETDYAKRADAFSDITHGCLGLTCQGLGHEGGK